jgi:hypothetical protein
LEGTLSRETSESSRGLGRYVALEAGWPGAIGYAVLGAVVIWLVSLVWPSGYRAEAGVLVHHNVERAVEDPSSDEAANYIDRETAVLESLASQIVSGMRSAKPLLMRGGLRRPTRSGGSFRARGCRTPRMANGGSQ